MGFNAELTSVLTGGPREQVSGRNLQMVGKVAAFFCLLSMDSGLKACGKGEGLPGFSPAEQRPACSLLVCLWASALAFWCVQVWLGTDPAGIPSRDGVRAPGLLRWFF